MVDPGQGKSSDLMDGRSGHMLGNRIDALIVAGWRVLETDFGDRAFQEWRKRALNCVAGLCGESHHYTGYFKSGVEKPQKSSVLTGIGLLTAAQLYVSGQGGSG